MERINTLQDIREHLISKIKHTNKLSSKERETVRKLQKKWNESHETLEKLSHDAEELRTKFEKVCSQVISPFSCFDHSLNIARK